ncbi:type I restriction-modification system subunit M N-terminal domain-containing protein [Thiocapsa bogorovii]|uniref:type I restriction-modification system subunit M N-terminal domain-containing protein n=1 Tax=Thiocapsa bogorovii TaxID=521689 RepID=UPI001E4EB10A|nr:type I restriction-modification system subunit M N-terminal domain-containing protein [Thiocapsa bogorovii]UHD15902.1 type I restriction-modification system subunit M N-terminal domain-containing protein [Thiocapsa bogorovii]
MGSLSAFVKGVCDVMRRSNCASALQYVPELTWILFLRILDAQEELERMAAEIQGRDFTPALDLAVSLAGLGGALLGRAGSSAHLGRASAGLET